MYLTGNGQLCACPHYILLFGVKCSQDTRGRTCDNALSPWWFGAVENIDDKVEDSRMIFLHSHAEDRYLVCGSASGLSSDCRLASDS